MAVSDAGNAALDLKSQRATSFQGKLTGFQCPGQEEIFGLFALSTRTTDIIFRPNQLICPYLGHVLSGKPTQVRHHEGDRMAEWLKPADTVRCS